MLAIINGKILTITKGVIDKGTILIEKGKIIKIGKGIKVPKKAKVINAKTPIPIDT